MKKRKDRERSLIELFALLPKTVDYRIHKFVSLNWPATFYKSPVSFSFYSHKAGWGFKTPDSYRISDHWNFVTRGVTHCQTTEPIENDTHWSIGKFDESLQKYKIVESYIKIENFEENLIKCKEIQKAYKLRVWDIEMKKIYGQRRYEQEWLTKHTRELQIFVNGTCFSAPLFVSRARVSYKNSDGITVKLKNKSFEKSDILMTYKDTVVYKKPICTKLEIIIPNEHK